MGFEAIVHFGGAGLARIVREGSESGRIVKAESLFPNTAQMDASMQHRPLLIVPASAIHLDELKNLPAGSYSFSTDHQGTVLLHLDLDALRANEVLLGGGTPTAYEDQRLQLLYEAGDSGVESLCSSSDASAFCVAVQIPPSRLAAEAVLPGKWEVDGKPTVANADRLKASFWVSHLLTLELGEHELSLLPKKTNYQPLPPLDLAFAHLLRTASETIHYEALHPAFDEVVGGDPKKLKFPKKVRDETEPVEPQEPRTEPNTRCPYLKFTEFA
ncbi:MAG: hypothetical protein DWQ36_14440 [Acidobacteria bacterium]|nr:MAG: hypothetical protein DWQ30_03175 [Acidobacteriota bacterium]REK06091.1 MAG: hypothetical protein DWQ36_14440 [Acidobacteriota bacterium]